MRPRVIARLDIKGEKLIKGIQLDGLFDKIVEKFRNKFIWKKNKLKKWELKHKVR